MSGRELRLWLVSGMLLAPTLVQGQNGRGAKACCVEGLGLGRPAASEVVFPVPPERPRIRYAGSLASERDLRGKRSFFGRLKGALLGTKEEIVSVNRPHDVYAFGDRMYVSDGGTGKVVVFDAATKAAHLLGTEGAGVLVKSMGLGGDGTGRVYVADQGGKRIVVFGPDGAFVTAYGGSEVLLNPVDVAVDPARGRVYVADAYLHQVVVFDRGGKVVERLGRDVGDLAAKKARTQQQAGIPAADDGVSENGTVANHHSWSYSPEPRDLVENRSTAPGEFNYPSFVAVAVDGSVHVSDGMNFRVQVFGADGGLRTSFGRLGDVPGAFARPKGVGVDEAGRVYVVDAAFNNIQIFDRDGQLLLPFGTVGRGDGQFWLPLGIHVDRDWIYVADRYNNRIQIFRFLGGDEG